MSTAIAPTRSKTAPTTTAPIPPLENGDHLTREEFERRYDAMPDLKKAELIEGVVYMASPVGVRGHGVPHVRFTGWVDSYLAATPNVEAADNSSVRLDMDNRPQPDLFLMIEPTAGGQSRVGEDDYLEGGPELIVEIAPSSASYDVFEKKRVYRRNRVQEYIAWRVRDQAIDWFVWRAGAYQRLEPGPDGILRSEVFPGLWLDPAAMIAGDRSTVARVLREGLATPEHAAFGARLEQAAQAPPPSETK